MRSARAPVLVISAVLGAVTVAPVLLPQADSACRRPAARALTSMADGASSIGGDPRISSTPRGGTEVEARP
jgi:hypothetical protein